MEMDNKKHFCPILDVDGVISGGKQFDLDITLPEDNRNVIYGIVKDCFKEPVSDAVIKLVEIVCEHGKEERRPIGHTFTDKEGEFVFGPLCPGKEYALQIWVNDTKKIKVCAKCHHEGRCLKGEKCEKCDYFMDNDDKHEKCDKCKKYEKYEEYEEYNKCDKHEKDKEYDKCEKCEKHDKDDKCEKCEKHDKDDKYDKCEKYEKHDKDEKDDKYEEYDKCRKHDKDDKNEKCEKHEKDEEYNKFDNYGKFGKEMYKNCFRRPGCR